MLENIPSFEHLWSVHHLDLQTGRTTGWSHGCETKLGARGFPFLTPSKHVVLGGKYKRRSKLFTPDFHSDMLWIKFLLIFGHESNQRRARRFANDRRIWRLLTESVQREVAKGHEEQEGLRSAPVVFGTPIRSGANTPRATAPGPRTADGARLMGPGWWAQADGRLSTPHRCWDEG